MGGGVFRCELGSVLFHSHCLNRSSRLEVSWACFWAVVFLLCFRLTVRILDCRAVLSWRCSSSAVLIQICRSNYTTTTVSSFVYSGLFLITAVISRCVVCVRLLWSVHIALHDFPNVLTLYSNLLTLFLFIHLFYSSLPFGSPHHRVDGQRYAVYLCASILVFCSTEPLVALNRCR